MPQASESGVRFALSTESTISKADAVRRSGLPLQAVIDIAQTIGCDGINVYPLESNVYRTISQEELPIEVNSQLLSGEMSFRSERTLWEVLAHPSPLLALQASLAYPERVSSLTMLEKVQEANHSAFIILYPHHGKALRNGQWWNPRWNEPQYPQFAQVHNKLLRPAPELLDRWGVSTTQEFIKEVGRQGYDWFCLNTKHLIREPQQGFTTRFEDFYQNVLQLLPYTKMIDLHPVQTSGKQVALDQYLQDKELELLKIAQYHHWKGIVILHFPFGQLKTTPETSRPLLEELKTLLR